MGYLEDWFKEKIPGRLPKSNEQPLPRALTLTLRSGLGWNIGIGEFKNEKLSSVHFTSRKPFALSIGDVFFFPPFPKTMYVFCFRTIWKWL